MSRKRNPYIPLFTHDIMSSMKCRRLSMRATGLYLWLLCLMNEKPQQGRWALSTNEDHPAWKNSLTYRALQNPDKYGRLKMFSTLLSSKFLPWKSGEVLKALQELYRFKLIVVEDDAIIQPRMYRDNGFKLREETMREYLKDDPTDPDDDPDPELVDIYKKDIAAGAADGKNKRTNKGTNKGTQKEHEIHAPAQNSESESEYENNNIKDNSIGNKGVQGEGKPKQSSKGKTDAPPPADDDKPRQPCVADNPPTLDNVKAYMQESGELGRIFRYITAEEYYDEGCKNGWRQRNGQPLYDWKAQLRSYEAYRRNHGDVPVSERGKTQQKATRQGALKQGVQVTEVKPGQYDEEW